MKILFFHIKIFAAKILSFFNCYINYPGLRFETQNIIRKYIKTGTDITIVCFGDSNTFGWNSKYQSSYPVVLGNILKLWGLKSKVINCGIGGDIISDAAKRLNKDVIFFKPSFVIINFGFNDAMLFKIKRNNNIKNKSNLLYVNNNDYYCTRTDIENFRCIFEKIINKLHENKIKVILAGLYKVNKISTGIFYDGEKEMVELQNSIYKEYDLCIKDIASKNNIPCLDLWNNLNNYEKIRLCLQKDGFHLGEESYKLIAECLSGIISKNCFL